MLGSSFAAREISYSCKKSFIELDLAGKFPEFFEVNLI
jgi:hypothetical protein